MQKLAMKKMSSAIAVKMLVIASKQIEDESPEACDEILACASKISNNDESYIENLDKSIVLASSKNGLVTENLMSVKAQFGMWDKVKGLGKGLGKGIGQGLGKAVQNVGKGIGQAYDKANNAIQQMQYQGISKKMDDDVRKVLQQFESNLDVNYLDKAIDDLQKSYTNTVKGLPQNIKTEFDKYFQILDAMPKGIETENQKAVDIMMSFVNGTRNKLGQAAGVIDAAEKAAAPQPAAAGTTVPPPAAAGTTVPPPAAAGTTVNPAIQKAEGVAKTKPGMTIKEYLRTPNNGFNELSPEFQEIIKKRNTKERIQEVINNLKKRITPAVPATDTASSISANTTAFSVKDLVKFSSSLDRVGLSKEAEEVLNLAEIYHSNGNK